jgi:hypothetical protein
LARQKQVIIIFDFYGIFHLFFLVINSSWGTGWGDSGYIKMSRNKRNQCGIATASSYPTV